MKIGILSDTHGYLDDAIFNHFAECDEIWHAGDIGSVEIIEQLNEFKPVRAVYGNIDSHEMRQITGEDAWFTLEGCKIWMTHIGGAPPRYNQRIKKILENRIPDIFVCGHSTFCALKKMLQKEICYSSIRELQVNMDFTTCELLSDLTSTKRKLKICR